MNVDSQEEIGERLRELREALGYTNIAEWCRFVGTTDEAWHPWEKGRRRITLEEATKVFSRTGAGTEYIYYGIESGLPHHLLMKLAVYREAKRA